MGVTRLKTTDLRIDELDILKAIGFMMVFLVHYNQSFSGVNRLINLALMYGQMGCQIFLLVTGYLFAASYERGTITHGGKYLGKKFMSLAPGYYLAMITYALLGILFKLLFGGTPFNGEYTLPGVLVNMALLQGFVPFCNNSVVPGGWYVGTIMLLFGLLVIIYPTIHKRVWSYRFAPLVSCAVAFVVGILVSKFDIMVLDNNSFFYYSVVCQAPAVLMGVLLFNDRDKIIKMSLWIAVTIFGGFTLITLALLAVDIKMLIPLIPFTAAVSYIGFYVIVCRLLNKGKFALLKRIGKASYGNYLFHFIFAWFVPYAVKKMNIVSNVMLFSVLLIPCFALSCVVGEFATMLFGRISKKLQKAKLLS